MARVWFSRRAVEVRDGSANTRNSSLPLTGWGNGDGNVGMSIWVKGEDRHMRSPADLHRHAHPPAHTNAQRKKPSRPRKALQL